MRKVLRTELNASQRRHEQRFAGAEMSPAARADRATGKALERQQTPARRGSAHSTVLDWPGAGSRGASTRVRCCRPARASWWLWPRISGIQGSLLALAKTPSYHFSMRSCIMCGFPPSFREMHGVALGASRRQARAMSLASLLSIFLIRAQWPMLR